MPNDEVDRLRWMAPGEALGVLTYGHDREVVRRAIGFDAPLYLLRHAKAGDRDDWTEDDLRRPLTKKGRRQSEALVEQFRDLRIDRVLSSPYDRCVQTRAPARDRAPAAGRGDRGARRGRRRSRRDGASCRSSPGPSCCAATVT